MKTSYTTVSKRIIDEIDSKAKDPVLRELVKRLLQFEMENWKMERKHFKDYYENEIESRCRKRIEQI